jgi:hypothetical protein
MTSRTGALPVRQSATQGAGALMLEGVPGVDRSLSCTPPATGLDMVLLSAEAEDALW